MCIRDRYYNGLELLKESGSPPTSSIFFLAHFSRSLRQISPVSLVSSTQPSLQIATPVKRGGKGGKFSQGPATFGGPDVAQKYKVHQNMPFKKAKFKIYFLRPAPSECFPLAPLWFSTSLQIAVFHIPTGWESYEEGRAWVSEKFGWIMGEHWNGAPLPRNRRFQ